MAGYSILPLMQGPLRPGPTAASAESICTSAVDDTVPPIQEQSVAFRLCSREQRPDCFLVRQYALAFEAHIRAIAKVTNVAIRKPDYPRI